MPDNGAAGGQLAATDPTWDVAILGVSAVSGSRMFIRQTRTLLTRVEPMLLAGGTTGRGSGLRRTPAPSYPKVCRNLAWLIRP